MARAKILEFRTGDEESEVGELAEAESYLEVAGVAADCEGEEGGVCGWVDEPRGVSVSGYGFGVAGGEGGSG